MSLLEQYITRRERIDKIVTELQFDTGNTKKNKVEAIRESAIYAKESEGYLPGLYYLVA